MTKAMTQEKPGEAERHAVGDTGECASWCQECASNVRKGLNPDGTARQPAAPEEPAWKYAGISLNPEHFETFAPEETSTHERRGLDGTAGTGADPGVSGERRAGNVPIEELIERSSLGAPEAKAVRAKTPRSVVDAVLKRADELRVNAPADGEREECAECGHPMALHDGYGCSGKRDECGCNARMAELRAKADAHWNAYVGANARLRERTSRLSSLESALAASEARTAELEGEAVSRERRANQYKEESDVRGQLLSAAQAENARLRGLLEDAGKLRDEWRALYSHQDWRSDIRQFAQGMLAAADELSAALASDPTKGNT